MAWIVDDCGSLMFILLCCVVRNPGPPPFLAQSCFSAAGVAAARGAGCFNIEHMLNGPTWPELQVDSAGSGSPIETQTLMWKITCKGCTV